ncbi:hypothetical protein FRC07_002868 [Ceratobasidium sp. 392]|nr:hypothetical protein FRC07_002868 [Ceratobasidium sp. 392]
MAAASLATILCSSVLAAALPAQAPFTADPIDPCKPANALVPGGTYYGGQAVDPKLPTRLRISNGGAGLSGLVGRLADEFIKYELKNSAASFKIEWIKGDTTETLGYLATGQADVGITYNKAAECQALHDKVAIRRENNPAGLKPIKVNEKPEDILQQFQKIVRTGNNPPLTGTPTRFLSRYDKSATNIKDSELFVRIGQVPWGLAYSKWYHQYTMYPIDALTAAALLNEYTITDRGTWLSTNGTITRQLTIYNEGTDRDPADPLLNPAFFLSGNNSCAANKLVADRFLNWTITEGQKVIEDFRKPDNPKDWLYTRAPVGSGQLINNCSAPGL